MSLNFCDLLVVGSDLSGLIAATLLAKRGLNVLVLDDDEEGEHLPNLATGLETRIFKSLMGKLMIPESKSQVVTENEIACQVVLPKHRIDSSPSRPVLLKEIDREFPEEREVFREFLAELDLLRENHLETFLSFLPLVDRKEVKQFSRWLRQFPDEKMMVLWNRLSPTLQSFLKLQLRFLARGPLLEPLSLQLMLYFSPENGTTFTIRGGLKELKKLFLTRLDYYGGMVHPMQGHTFNISSKGREIREIQLDHYNFPTRCRYLLGNLNWQTFFQKLPKNLWSFWQKKKVAGQNSQGVPYHLQFEVDRSTLPGPMKENAVIVGDPSKPLEGLNYLEINLSSPNRSEGEKLNLTVSYWDQEASDQKGTVYYEELHKEIEKKIRWLIPFADSSLKRIFPHQNGDAGNLFPESGDLPLFLRQAEKGRSYSPSFLFPSLKTPFKNGFLLGPNVLEWLGMEGKILAGLKAVELIWEKESKLKKT